MSKVIQSLTWKKVDIKPAFIGENLEFRLWSGSKMGSMCIGFKPCQYAGPCLHWPWVHDQSLEKVQSLNHVASWRAPPVWLSYLLWSRLSYSYLLFFLFKSRSIIDPSIIFTCRIFTWSCHLDTCTFHIPHNWVKSKMHTITVPLHVDPGQDFYPIKVGTTIKFIRWPIPLVCYVWGKVFTWLMW